MPILKEKSSEVISISIEDIYTVFIENLISLLPEISLKKRIVKKWKIIKYVSSNEKLRNNIYSLEKTMRIVENFDETSFNETKFSKNLSIDFGNSLNNEEKVNSFKDNSLFENYPNMEIMKGNNLSYV